MKQYVVMNMNKHPVAIKNTAREAADAVADNVMRCLSNGGSFADMACYVVELRGEELVK